jgi:5-methylthioadenosine/S-adenosylhomocysteine deaminase
MDSQNTLYKNGAVIIKSNKIIDIGDSSIAGAYQAIEEIDARGNIVMPGLINSHTHAPMTIFRGMADDMPLHDWLNNYIFPAEAKFLNATNVKLGAQLACHEMLRTGTTTFADMYYFEDEIARVAISSGIRCLLSEALIDFPVPNNPTPQHSLDYTEMLLSKYQGHDLVHIAVGPHSPYTCSPEWLQKGRALANKHNIPLHIHLAETMWEKNQCLTTHGCTPTKNLDNHGILDGKTLAAHTIHVTDDDIQLLSQRGVSAINNPQSNMKLASGVCPVPSLMQAGCNVALGTDGVVSNNSLDMFAEMKTAALVHKVYNNNPALTSAFQVMQMATIQGAKSLGLDHLTGSLEKNKRADLIIIDVKHPGAQPLYNVYSNIVYSLNGSNVDTVIVDGTIVVRNKTVKNIDVDTAIDELNDLSDSIARELNIDKI